MSEIRKALNHLFRAISKSCMLLESAVDAVIREVEGDSKKTEETSNKEVK